MLLLDLKKLKKEAEKRWIQHVVANLIHVQANINYKKTKAAAVTECTSVKENLQSNSEKLTDSIKGKFSKQVSKTIKTEAEKIDQL